MEAVPRNNDQGFESLTWLFTCDSRNRGIIRQGFNEAALLWRAVKATSGTVLEIGRNRGGSTVLLTAAAGSDRAVYSIDLRSREHRACKDYLSQPERSERVHLLVGVGAAGPAGVVRGAAQRYDLYVGDFHRVAS